MTTYQPTLSGALAHEHVTDLLRQAATSRAAAQAPAPEPAPHRATPPTVVGPRHRSHAGRAHGVAHTVAHPRDQGTSALTEGSDQP